jgi:aryl-alcohol dehydrogenase-like predicted oxidoreductase
VIPSRKLGRDAPQVSAVGYGGMHLSIQERPPEEQGIRVIHAALDAGVTLIDTADVYCLDDREIGHNERLIARALRSYGGSKEKVIVGTKGGMARPGGQWVMAGRPEQLRAACDRSLKALGVNQIDLYQLHTPDRAVPLTDSVGALADLRREGKIRWVGLSNVSVTEIVGGRARSAGSGSPMFP